MALFLLYKIDKRKTFMRNLIIIINLSIIIAITTIFTQSERLQASLGESISEVSQAGSVSPAEISSEISSAIRSTFPSKSKETTEETSAKASNKVVSSFLSDMILARMVDLEAGKTATQRGTFRPLKDFGALVAEDHQKMLEDLRKIALKKDIAVPQWISPERATGLNALREVHGKTFDKKFLKSTISDLKRDAKILKNATESSDADIQVFATRYLPVMESHLTQAKALKKKL